MAQNLFHAREGNESLRIDPDTVGWRHLGMTVFSLAAGETREVATAGREAAVIALSGGGVVHVGGDCAYRLARRSLFEEMGSLLYVPPGAPLELAAADAWSVAIATAPASGRYPVRLVEPEDTRVEIRGGGAALRQVNHLLAPPLPAERLIIYEVFVPGGSWAGWPPHCHDGLHGSPYLEETYLFQFDKPDGFGFHRNYLADGSYDETFVVHDRDCVAVPRGFHVTTAAPGSNMWILNFLAGDPVDDERATPPYFDPSTTWITQDWARGQMPLPAGTPRSQTSPTRP
jgi:5-deoxy-glucuronate isomerase